MMGLYSERKRFGLGRQLAASTLLETITAMVLLSVAFSAGMLIYLNVLNSNSLEIRSRANIALEAAWQTTKEKEAFVNNDFSLNGFQIERKVSPAFNQNDLLLLEFTAFTPDERKVATLKVLHKYE